MPPISGAWAKALEGEFHKPYYKKLFETVGKEYATHQIFPAGDDIFNAFHFTPLDQVKVVYFYLHHLLQPVRYVHRQAAGKIHY